MGERPDGCCVVDDSSCRYVPLYFRSIPHLTLLSDFRAFICRVERVDRPAYRLVSVERIRFRYSPVNGGFWNFTHCNFVVGGAQRLSLKEDFMASALCRFLDAQPPSESFECVRAGGRYTIILFH